MVDGISSGKSPTLRAAGRGLRHYFGRRQHVCKVGFISYNARPLRGGYRRLEDVKIHMHENIAVVTAGYHERGELGGKPYDYRDRLTTCG